MRNFSGPVITALQAETGERVYLIKLDYSGGTKYLTTGSRDLYWDGQTWDAVGGNLSLGMVEQTEDSRSGPEITLSGVDQSITAILLAQQYRGRVAEIRQAILNQTTGVVTDTILLFEGRQLDNYEIEERVERGKPLTCTIRTRVLSRLAVAEYRGIRTNLHGHQRYFTADTFFKHVASFTTRKIYWGTTAPTTPRGGSHGGSGQPPDEGDDTRIVGDDW